MNEKNETKVSQEFLKRMHNCLEEMAEAKGVERCALIYAMAQLIDGVQKAVMDEQNIYEAKIKELEAKLDSASLESVNQ